MSSTSTTPTGSEHRPGRVTYALAAVVALALGTLGLVLGAFPEAGPAPAAAAPPPADGVVAGSIRVSGAYVREPASPEVAAAYFTIGNTGNEPDTLLAVTTGASRSATLMDVPGAPVAPAEEDSGTPDMTPNESVTIPGGATVTLAPGQGHLMLADLVSPLEPGDRVSLLLSFEHAGEVLLDAPVIAIEDPAPGGHR